MEILSNISRLRLKWFAFTTFLHDSFLWSSASSKSRSYAFFRVFSQETGSWGLDSTRVTRELRANDLRFWPDRAIIACNQRTYMYNEPLSHSLPGHFTCARISWWMVLINFSVYLFSKSAHILTSVNSEAICQWYRNQTGRRPWPI